MFGDFDEDEEDDMDPSCPDCGCDFFTEDHALDCGLSDDEDEDSDGE